MSQQQDFREKFAGLLQNKKAFDPFIELFDRLTASTVYSAEEKPHCFAMLVSEAVTRIKLERQVEIVLDAMRRNQAMPQARSVLSVDDADVLAARLVARVLDVSPRTTEALTEVMCRLLRTDVAKDRGQLIGFAALSKMDEATLDLVCDLTHDALITARG